MTPSAADPLLPASYDLVWSLVLLALLVAVVLAVVLAARALRRRPPGTTVERVRALAELRDSGAITPEEYEERKDRVLADL